ncbi:hypothetical protein D3C71_1691420 [compost metagenome]
MGQRIGITFHGPVARAVGRQHFIHQHQLAVFVQAEFEFGVCNDHALFQGNGGCLFVDGNAQVADLGG